MLLLFFLGMILFLRGGTPFSPGPLSAAGSAGQTLGGFRSHADFEGDCSLCHKPWRGVSAERCEKCHTMISEQRNTRLNLHGHLPVNSFCQQCHTEHNGRSASMTTYLLSNFDHEMATDYSLERHLTNYDGTAMNCLHCHQEETYKGETVNCLACHAANNSEFMTGHVDFYGEECLVCHDGIDSMIGFDHAGVFPLDGAHSAIDCQACHTMPVASGTPNVCSDCHEEPAVHAGLFGFDCSRCHTTRAWLPAQLNQHTFPIDHGNQGKLVCQVCHSGTYAEYTCFGCHEHETTEIWEEHLEEGIGMREIENCFGCHPTGREGE